MSSRLLSQKKLFYAYRNLHASKQLFKRWNEDKAKAEEARYFIAKNHELLLKLKDQLGILDEAGQVLDDKIQKSNEQLENLQEFAETNMKKLSKTRYERNEDD